MTLIEDIKDEDSSFNAASPLERLRIIGARVLTDGVRCEDLRRAYGYERYVDDVADAMTRGRSVLLLGPSGVGKTAVLHELAARIVAGTVPAALTGAAIVAISTSTVLESARYWGDWEVKISAIVKAVRECSPAALYVTNIWNLRQSGTNQYSSEGLATILRPYLERGEVALLGEATPEQYHSGGQDGALADDPSLLRLFHVVTVDPPSTSVTAAILAARAAEEERRRGVRIAPTVLDRCLALTSRFQRSLAQPGTAIALLEGALNPWPAASGAGAGAVAAEEIGSPFRPAVVTSARGVALLERACRHEKRAVEWEGAGRYLHILQRLVACDDPVGASLYESQEEDADVALGAESPSSAPFPWLSATPGGATDWPVENRARTALAAAVQEAAAAQREVAAAQREVAAAYLDLALDTDVLEQARHAPATMRAPELPVAVGAAIDTALGQMDAGAGPKLPVLTADLVQAAFRRLTGLPEAIFSDTIPLRRHEVRDELAAHVIGQDEALEIVVDRIIAIKAELTDPGRPLGVLLCAGPTGVGKTLLARRLAALLCGDDGALLRLDMSEYQTPLSAGLFPGALARGIGRRCFTVVLLDEIEKAHPAVYDLLLAAFDDGQIGASSGQLVDLRNTLIILTSNLGADLRALAPRRPVGYTGTMEVAVWGEAAATRRLEAAVEAAIREQFRPELVNRLDHIITFRPLDHAAVCRIARQEITRALRRSGVARRRLAVTVDDAVVEAVVVMGWTVVDGARPLQRAVAALVVTPVAAWIAARPERCDTAVRLTLRAGAAVVVESAPAGAQRIVPADLQREADAENLGASELYSAEGAPSPFALAPVASPAPSPPTSPAALVAKP